MRGCRRPCKRNSTLCATIGDEAWYPRKGMCRVARLLLTVSLLLLASVHVYAQPTPEQREKARAFANEGLALFKKGDYEGAIDSFEKAEALVHAPPHALYIARAHAKTGKLRAARELMREASA